MQSCGERAVQTEEDQGNADTKIAILSSDPEQDTTLDAREASSS